MILTINCQQLTIDHYINHYIYVYIHTYNIYIYMVGGIPTPLKNMSSSVGNMTFPIYGK